MMAPPVKPKSTCLICLRRFQGGANNGDGDDSAFKRRILEGGGGAKGKKKDVYTRFMTCVGRYFKLGRTTERFIQRQAQEREGSKRHMEGTGDELDAFCGGCLELVTYVCDLYEELRIVQLHLIWKLGQLGEVMERAKGDVSGKLAKASVKSLAAQLNMRMMGVETFRKVLRMKCGGSSKAVAPKVLVPQGMFPEEWKFTYPFVKKALMSLIVIFALASSAVYTKQLTKLKTCNSDIKEEGDENEGGVRGKILRRQQRKRKGSSKPFRTIRNSKETGDTGGFLQEAGDDGGSPDEEGGGDGDASDVDWTNDYPSPASANSEASYEDHNLRNTANPHKLRKRRKSLTIKEELASNSDTDSEAEGTSGKKHKPGSKSSKLECKFCKKVCKGAMGLATHLRHAHRGSQHYSCPHCGRKFEKGAELMKHTQQAHPDKMRKRVRNGKKNNTKSSKCNFCTEKFSLKSSLAEHNRTVHAMTSRTDECLICLKKVRRELVLLRHLQTHLREFPCERCDKCFVSKTALSEHLAEEHANGFPCLTCEETYPTSESLRDHLQSHETGEEKYFCVFCHRSFTNEQHFEIHVKQFHISKGSKYYCDHSECSEDFRTIGELNVHLTSHWKDIKPTNLEENLPENNSDEENKIFSCKICKWSFLTRYNLALHELVHIQPEKVMQRNRYKCPGCRRWFFYQELLTSHWNYMHGLARRPFRCSTCNLKYIDFLTYKTHLRIHHDRNSGKKFACEICAAEFLDSFNLREHRRGHDPASKSEDEDRQPNLDSNCKGNASKRREHSKGAPRLRKMPRTDTEDEMERVRSAWADLNCSVCKGKASFHSPAALRKHLMDKHESSQPEKTISCSFCHLKFAFKQTHELHVLAEHVQKRKFVCDDETCIEVFDSHVELNQHLQKHLEEDAEPSPSPAPPPSEQGPTIIVAPPNRSISFCKTCEWGFLNPAMLELHELCHTHPKGNLRFPEFPCPKCDTEYCSVTKLSKHYNTCHGLNLKPFKCTECPQRFSCVVACRNHIYHHGAEGKNKMGKYPCKLCGSTYGSYRSLWRHSKKHHFETRVLCPDCGTSLADQAAYKRHLIKVHRRGGHLCPTCGAVCFTTGALDRHLQSHENGSLTCHVCQKIFQCKQNLRRHIATRHDPNRVAEFVCSECGMAYKSEAGLEFHVKSKHSPEEELRFGCLYCPKRYDRFALFKAHMRACMNTHGISPDDGEALAALTPPVRGPQPFIPGKGKIIPRKAKNSKSRADAANSKMKLMNDCKMEVLDYDPSGTTIVCNEVGGQDAIGDDKMWIQENISASTGEAPSTGSWYVTNNANPVEDMTTGAIISGSLELLQNRHQPGMDLDMVPLPLARLPPPVKDFMERQQEPDTN